MRDPVGLFLMRWRIRVVLPHVRGRLLDIGCGLNALVRNYGNGIGCDVYDWGDVQCLVEDTADLPFEDQSFDTVTIIAALNHIPNRMDVLTDANRVLAPNGRLIVTMIPPRISAIWHKIREPWDDDQSERGMADGEVYGLTHKQTRNLIENASFSVEDELPFMFWINRLGISRKVAHNQSSALNPR